MTMTTERPDAASQAARRAMIDSQLRTSGVNDPWVLSVMASVPREDFVPEAFRSAAYIDRALPLDNGRFLAPPLVHGMMLAEVAPTKEDTALLIGDGKGYLAALLGPLVGTLESIDPADVAGKPRKGPYSLIVIDGAAEELPEALGGWLAEDGRLVTGIVARGVTRLAVGRKTAGQLAILTLAELGIPVLPEFSAPRRWSF